MINLGDITKISGYNAPTVDVVIGGSPCQDLSIAGKRAGLAGERSGLYMEQIRIIKEMREHDRSNGRAAEFIRPRYMVWENVPGAFSSNHGKDFAAVLEEAVRVIEPEAPHVPVPEKGWSTSGCLMGDGWSVAWRVLDAQFWGVPQRRRRIALVADFGGHTAPEILFVREGVSGHIEPSRTERKATSGGAEESTGNPVYCLQGNGIDRADTAGCNGKGWKEDVSYTLNTIDRPAVCAGFKLGNSEQARSIGYVEEQDPTLNAECGGNKPAVLVLNDQGGSKMCFTTDIAGTLWAQEHRHQPCMYSFDSLASNSMKSNNPNSGCRVVDVAKTLDTSVPDPSKNQGGVCILDMTHPFDVIRECGDTVPTLRAIMGTWGNNVPLVADVGLFSCTADVAPPMLSRAYKDPPIVKEHQKTVRRITPLECERLQGFPDGWTDIGDWVDSKGKKRQTTDSARYKALGNSIALPPWKWVLKRLSAQYERDATMASLFDGIGGFPLIWEQLNGRGSCLWASEIDEFPIAVTRQRFREEQ